MFRTSRCLKQLDKELLALGEDAMLLEELDGFIVVQIAGELLLDLGFVFNGVEQ